MSTPLRRLALFALCLALAVLSGVCAASVRAFNLCALPYTSLSVGGVGRTNDTDVLDAVAAWELDASQYENAYGRPLYQINLQTDGTKQGRVYILIYADRTSEEQVVVFTYSYTRLFDTDGDLHNHPDLCAGVMERSNIDALLAALE